MHKSNRMEKINLCNCSVWNFGEPEKYYFSIFVPVGLHDVTSVEKPEELKIHGSYMLPEGDLYIFETDDPCHDEDYIRSKVTFIIYKECIQISIDKRDTPGEEIIQKLNLVFEKMKGFDEMDFDTFCMNLCGNCNKQMVYNFPYSERVNVVNIVRILNDAGINTTMRLRFNRPVA